MFQRNPVYFNDLFCRLANSRFRSSFKLRSRETAWFQSHDLKQAREHARTFIETRLADAFPKNDGKQTPMKGHPVFIAQHATGCCCRSCLEKWHHIPRGRPLNAFEKQYIEEVLLFWLERQTEQNAAGGHSTAQPGQRRIRLSELESGRDQSLVYKDETDE